MQASVGPYALRTAGAFMISLATIWPRTGLMPRWLAGLTYALAAVLLVVSSLNLWTTLVFPGWVLLVSVLFLDEVVRLPGRGAGRDVTTTTGGVSSAGSVPAGGRS